MRATNEVRVGLVVVLALTLMILGYFFLRGLGLGADVYYLRLTGPASVSPGNDVRLQGVKIGQVQEVTLDPDTKKPLLTLAVRRAKPRFDLLQSYKYTVQSSAIIGDSYVDISGPYDPGSIAYVPNDESQVIVGQAQAGFTGVTDQATKLMKDFSVTLSKFNVTIDRINKGVLSYQNQAKLTQALEDVTKLTRQIGQSFGPQGVGIRFGDPRSQRALNDALANAAVASREASISARNIRVLTMGLNNTLSENRGQLRLLLFSLKGAADNVAGLTESLKFVVQKGGLQENMQLTLNAVRRAAENVEASTAGLKAITGDVNTQNNLRTAIATLTETTRSLLATAQSINTVVADPETQGQLKGIVTSLNVTAQSLQATAAVAQATATDVQTTIGGPLKATAETVQATAKDLQTTLNGPLKVTAENLAATSGGLKNVVTDPQVQSDLKAIPSELRGTLTATRATAERVNALLGGRKKRNDTGQPGAPKAQHPGYSPGGFDFTARSYVDRRGGPRTGSDVRGDTYGDLTFNTELFGGPFRLGLANIGEGADVTLQSGRFLGKTGAARYGLYRSKLGAGVDLHKRRFSVEANLWDPNKRSYNAYVGYRVAPQVEVLLGHEKIRGVRTNALGVRLTP